MMQWLFELDPDPFALFSSVIALLLQFLLCRIAKRTLVKLIPMALLALTTIALIICSVYAEGWDAFDYLGLAIVCFWLILVCAVSWFFCAAFGKSHC